MQLFDSATLLTYCLAAAALVASPGPGQALVIARTIQGGMQTGMVTSLGLATGTLVHTLAAALGLSAVLATSATAFTVIKYAGAVYLIALGLMMLRQSTRDAASESTRSEITPVTADVSSVERGRILLHGALTGVLNPKVAVFFLAFLPQFVHPERGGLLIQFMVLGFILAVFGVLGDSVLAFAVCRARRRLSTNPRFLAWRERITGSILILLGLRLAFVERR